MTSKKNLLYFLIRQQNVHVVTDLVILVNLFFFVISERSSRNIAVSRLASRRQVFARKQPVLPWYFVLDYHNTSCDIRKTGMQNFFEQPRFRARNAVSQSKRGVNTRSFNRRWVIQVAQIKIAARLMLNYMPQFRARRRARILLSHGQLHMRDPDAYKKILFLALISRGYKSNEET